MWALGLAGVSSESPHSLLKTLVGKGASSRVGAFHHSGVLFDEQPEMKNVRSKALRSLAAKAQAVVGEGDVGYVVYKSAMLVRRDRPQHVDEQLHSRQGCLWGSIHGRSCCCLGQFVGWLCMRPVRSIVYSGAGRSISGCTWYAETRLIYKPSSVFVQYAYRKYRIRSFSSPIVAVSCCETNRKSLFCGIFAQVTRGSARVSTSECGLVASHGQGGRRSRHSTYRT